MHQQVLDWLASIKRQRPDIFTDVAVLECGSLNINGTPRHLFEDVKEYIGIDWRDGPDVDVVKTVHHYYRAEPFDTVISTEMLEHDPYWPVSIIRMIALLRVGGNMLLTFGGRNRKAHEVNTSPITGYYKGLSSLEVLPKLLKGFRAVHVWDDQNDVYMWCEEKL